MMSLTADHTDARLKWCQSNKIKNWDLVNFGDQTVFSDFRKSKKSGYRKTQFIELQKLTKVRKWAVI